MAGPHFGYGHDIEQTDWIWKRLLKMLEGKTVLVVVPARGGSKGIPLKNLMLFRGKPLVTWAGEIACNLSFADQQIISTDLHAIADVATEAGLNFPFLRPDDLSGDIVSDAQVLIHALQEMELLDQTRYDIILMLQPTSPMRTAAQVTEVVNLLIEEGSDSVFTVSPTNLKYHPLKQFELNQGRVNFYDPAGKKIVARQQLTQTFHRNGIAYAMTRECLLEQEATIGRDALAIITEGPAINIDTLEDLKLS